LVDDWREEVPKNIVFCADGTWNGDSEDPADITNPTNVLKLFHNLAGVDSIEQIRLADEQERVLSDQDGAVLQIAKYLHGVGDSSNWLIKLVGGTVGTGLISRVIRGYTFLSRNYQPGDQIFLVGFSRGSYTARALAGLIADKGLLNANTVDLQDDRESAYKLGAAVWYAYRRERLQGDPNRLGKLEEMVTLLPGFFTSPVAPQQMVPNVQINTVAVWDTVGALGIPVFGNEGNDVDSLRFVDTELSAQVQQAFHAISLDEQRFNFPACFFDPDPQNPSRIVQVLFPGAHSDVGGGYEESDLSDGSLEWMTNRLHGQGLLLLDPLAYLPDPNALGISHQPWLHVPWSGLAKVVRVGPNFDMIPGLLVHDSIEARRAVGTVVFDPVEPVIGKYDPPNLKKSYLDPNGAVIATCIYQEPPTVD
jgi:uncharacterized protein (DUF2235 family)